MSRPTRSFPLLAAALLAAGLVGGFAVGRVSAPSDLAELKGRILLAEPDRGNPADGIDNDGEIILSVKADGTLAEAGARFIEQTGAIRLGAQSAAAEPVFLFVEQETPGGSGVWEIVYSTEIAPGEPLVGSLAIEQSGSYRLSSAPSSAPDTLSSAFLSAWTPE